MAMNKSEKELMENLKTQLALRWTSPVAPDVMPPKESGELSKGFLPLGELSDYPRVEPACSSIALHGIGRNDRTDRQLPCLLYSTKLLALKALRYAVEKRCAAALRRIDLMIEQEQGE